MPPHAVRPPLRLAFFVAIAATLALQLGAYTAPGGARPVLVAAAWVAAGLFALVSALVVVRRSRVPGLRRSWLLWALAAGTWLVGALLRLVGVLTGADGLQTAADVAWLAAPGFGAISIAFDAPRGSLSFGLFLLDALPLVLFLTVLVRLAAPHPLEEHAHEALLLGFPLLYGLAAIVGLQLLALERNRRGSPDLWGFAVTQPLLAVAAFGWPALAMEGALRPLFPWDALWTLGMLAAAVSAARRAEEPDTSPILLPLDERGLRALPPALGVLGLLVVTALAPASYRVVPASLTVVSLACFTARAFLVQRQHRLSHASLLESEETLRTLVGNIPGAVYRCALDPEWTIQFMSEEIESLTGHPASDFVGNRRQTFGSIEHPEDTSSLNAHIRNRVAAGRPYTSEYRIVRADGDVRWVLDRGQAVYGRGGMPLWIDGVLLDVTERKQAETRLERQTELLWLLQRVAVAANEAREVEEALLACTEEICASTGWPVGHVLVRSDGSEELRSAELWHVDDAEAAARFRSASEVLRFGAGVDLPGRVLVSGRAEWLEDLRAEEAPRAPFAAELGFRSAFAFPVLVGTEVAGVLEFFSSEPCPRDDELLRVMANIGTVLGRVVERKRSEAALAAQNERLRELDGLKDEFVSLVSHELRTPLTSIRGYLELVLEDEKAPLSDEHRDFLGVVQRNADRLLRLVGDLLFVAQVDAGRLSVEREEVDLAALAAECAQAAEPIAAGRRVRVVLETEPAYLVGDRARLAQLLDNLLSNALKFTPENGEVIVRVRPGTGTVEVEVADSGIGIPAAEQERLFERFFRSSNARRAAIQGTGLGLAIVRAIAEAHGGSVAVESTEGEGTTFRVELPASAPPIHVPADEPAPAEGITVQEVA